MRQLFQLFCAYRPSSAKRRLQTLSAEISVKSLILGQYVEHLMPLRTVAALICAVLILSPTVLPIALGRQLTAAETTVL